EPAMRDRIIIGVIAFSQLLLSLLSLMAGSNYPRGPFFFFFSNRCLIIGGCLLFFWLLPRKTANVRRTHFFVYIGHGVLVTSNQPQHNQGYWFFVLWGAGGLAAIFYLASGLGYLD